MKISRTLAVNTLVFALCFIISIPLNAQNLPDSAKKGNLNIADSSKHSNNSPWKIIAPTASIAIGASSFVIKPVRNFDYYIRGEIKKSDPHFHTNAESYLQFAPIIMVYGLNIIGVRGKNDFADRTAILGLSATILGVTEYSTRYATHNSRPIKNSVFSSFPSGHVATAFMGAEFLAEEYSGQSPVIAVAGYAIAATTGVFRMYNRKHTFSEVIAGAGYGILSTKAAYFLYPRIRKVLTHKDKQGRSTVIMPVYQDGTAGLSFAMTL
jgi:membrane-associated phospholipid phosphatase